MKVELGPRIKEIEGLEEAFAQQTPSRGNFTVSVRLIGLRRHLSRSLRIAIVKERAEGEGAAVVAPS